MIKEGREERKGKRKEREREEGNWEIRKEGAS